MLSPVRLRKDNINQAVRELELLAEKLETAQSEKRFDTLKKICDEIQDAARCYIRNRIRRSADDTWSDFFHGVIFPNGILIRMTRIEGMVDTQSAFQEFSVMGIAYKYGTGTPEVRLRCIRLGKEIYLPFDILSSRGVARLLRVLSKTAFPKKHKRKSFTYNHFTMELQA